MQSEGNKCKEWHRFRYFSRDAYDVCRSMVRSVYAGTRKSTPHTTEFEPETVSPSQPVVELSVEEATIDQLLTRLDSIQRRSTPFDLNNMAACVLMKQQ